MYSTAMSLNSIVAAIACLCTSSHDMIVQFAGTQNLTVFPRSAENENHLKLLSMRIQNLEGILSQIEQKQESMLLLLKDNLEAVHLSNPELQPNSPQLGANNPCAKVPLGYSQVVSISQSGRSFEVLCKSSLPHGLGWLVIQRRFDGTTNFNRPWKDYKEGFGTLNGEFFIGLETIYQLTSSHAYELLITMTDFEKRLRFARYEEFAIANEEEFYALRQLGAYEGDSGDSFTPHKGLKFSTFDKDNDLDAKQNCASTFKGGWWYGKCLESNLNGEYIAGKYPADKFSDGIVWKLFHGYDYSLKSVEMAIRRK